MLFKYRKSYSFLKSVKKAIEFITAIRVTACDYHIMCAPMAFLFEMIDTLSKLYLNRVDNGDRENCFLEPITFSPFSTINLLK